MNKKFMVLVARALYTLILMGTMDYPYLNLGKRIDSILIALEDFYNGDE